MPASSGPATASPATARARIASTADGVDVVHAIVDDHSRLAYAEIHTDERAATVAGFLERALSLLHLAGDHRPHD